MDPVLPEDIDSLTPEALRELHAQFVAAAAELQAKDLKTVTVAESRELRRLITDANTIAGTIKSLDPVASLEDLPEEPVEVTETAVEAEETTEADTVEAEAFAHTASLKVTDLTLPARQAQEPSETSTSLVKAPFRASAGQQTVASNSELSITQLGEVFEDARRNAVSSREMPKTYLASVAGYRDDAPRLSAQNGPAANTALINSLPQHPRTAAICGPVDIIREIPTCTNADRPIRDLFRRIPSDRGAFQFNPTVGLADVTDGTTIWTDAQQALVDEADPSTWKPCHILDCATTVTEQVTAISACLIADVKQDFSSPEQIQNNITVLMDDLARTAETALLARIDLLSSAYTFAGNYGALHELAQFIAAVTGNSQSLTGNLGDPYVAILPAGLRKQLAMDVIARGQCCAEDAMRFVDATLGSVGARVVETTAFSPTNPWAGFTLNPPGAAAVALPAIPNDWQIRVIDPNAAFFFDTAEIPFGMQRSPELSRQNKIQWFGELFEGLAKQGCAPWYTGTLELCPNGGYAGLVTPFTCT